MAYIRSYKMLRWCLGPPLGLLLILNLAHSIEVEQANLSLTIVVPAHNSQRTIQVGSHAAGFHVIIENASERQVKLWREWNSWGYFNLKFQVTNKNGDTWLVSKKETLWEKNFPDFVSVDSNGKLVIDVTFSREQWDNILPTKLEQPTIVSMVAIYESEDSEHSRKRGVWSGRVLSTTGEYTLLPQ